ncbi:MAG: hypothetical protein AB8F95_19790 [Bacteroidia bacterium]
MQGFSPVNTSSSQRLVIAKHIEGVLEEIRSRQMLKHAPKSETSILDDATHAFKNALIASLLEPVLNQSCHLATMHKQQALLRLTQMDA